MPTDPVQVVAEARCLHRSDGGPCHITWNGFHPQCAVAALMAARALMPEEAEELHREFGYRSTDAEEWETAARERYALLQEALSVLGPHCKTVRRKKLDNRGHLQEVKLCAKCYNTAPCPEASFAEKIGKAIGGEG